MTELKCKHCGRHLGEAKSIVAELLCKCTGSTQFKVLNSDVTKLYSYKFTTPERQPKKKEAPITKEDLSATTPEVS